MTGGDIAVDGGGLVLALVALALVAATILIGIWVALIAYRGYRQTGDRPTLYLAAGIALLSTVHTLTRLVLSSARVPSLLSDSMAVAVQFVGLLLVLYAVYGRPEQGGYRDLLSVLLGAVAVVASPFALLEVVTVDQSLIIAGVNGIAAIVGSFVALQAYRGYRRYRNRAMLLLAVGVGLLTVAPFVVSVVMHGVGSVSDATVLAGMWFLQVAGLLSILRSLTG